MNDNAKHNRYIIFGAGILIVIIIVIFTVLILHRNSTVTTVEGAPLQVASSRNTCSDVLGNNTATVNQTLLSYINTANKLNGKETKDQYDVVVRNNSCTNSTKTAEGTNINGQNFSYVVNNSDFIVDITDAKQSWAVNLEWTDNPNMSNGPGQIQISCPANNQLVYGDFNCQKVLDYMSIQDTILNCNYTGGATPGYAGFNSVFNPDWRIDAATLSGLQEGLNAAIGTANLDKPVGQQVTCVNAVTDNSSFSVDQQTYVSTFTFQVQFITNDGTLSAHTITFTVGSGSGRTYTLDGQGI